MARTLVHIVVVALVIAVTIASAAPGSSDSISVTCFYTLRADEYQPDGRRPRSYSDVLLVLHGKLLKKAGACANISIEKAIDAAGADLTNLDAFTFGSNVASQRIRLCSLPGYEPAAQIHIYLGPLSKGAGKLACLKGRLQLMVLSDETRELTIPHLKSCLHNKIAVPQFAQEHLKLSVFEAPEHVKAFLEGNTKIIKKMEIDGAHGKTISKRVSDDGVCPFRQFDFTLPRDVDDRMSLKVQFAAKHRIVSVPFDLKEFPDP